MFERNWKIYLRLLVSLIIISDYINLNLREIHDIKCEMYYNIDKSEEDQ